MVYYGPNWETSRAEHKKNQEAIEYLRLAFKNYNRAYQTMERAFLKNTATYSTVLRTIENPDSTQLLDKSFKELRETIIAHHEALAELQAAQERLFAMNDSYLLSSLKRLWKTYRVAHSKIADAFGIHGVTLWRRMKKDDEKNNIT